MPDIEKIYTELRELSRKPIMSLTLDDVAHLTGSFRAFDDLLRGGLAGPAAWAERPAEPEVIADVECIAHGVVPGQPSGGCRLCDEGEEPYVEDLAHTFSMQAVVDLLKARHPDVIAYVEQTGGGCATIYAARRKSEDSDEPALYPLGGLDAGHEDWPVLAGPGSFDWAGTDHVGYLEDFYVGVNANLDYQPPTDAGLEYTATREDTVESLAERIAATLDSFAHLAGVRA